MKSSVLGALLLLGGFLTLTGCETTHDADDDLYQPHPSRTGWDHTDDGAEIGSAAYEGRRITVPENPNVMPPP